MNKKKIIGLGLESSCDETAASVIENGRHIRSNIIKSQIDLHKEFFGVVPEIASRAHLEVINALIQKALDQAGISFRDLDYVAATSRPGLVGSLLWALFLGYGRRRLLGALPFPVLGLMAVLRLGWLVRGLARVLDTLSRKLLRLRVVDMSDETPIGMPSVEIEMFAGSDSLGIFKLWPAGDKHALATSTRFDRPFTVSKANAEAIIKDMDNVLSEGR